MIKSREIGWIIEMTQWLATCANSTAPATWHSARAHFYLWSITGNQKWRENPFKFEKTFLLITKTIIATQFNLKYNEHQMEFSLRNFRSGFYVALNHSLLIYESSYECRYQESTKTEISQQIKLQTRIDCVQDNHFIAISWVEFISQK